MSALRRRIVAAISAIPGRWLTLPQLYATMADPKPAYTSLSTTVCSMAKAGYLVRRGERHSFEYAPGPVPVSDGRATRHGRPHASPVHTGATARLRAALERGPATVAELIARSGLHADIVRRYLSQMVTRGGFVVANDERPQRYFLYRDMPRKVRPEPPAGDFRIAQRITIGRGAKWGAGLA